MAIPVFLPGESHGQRTLAGYSPQDHKELDATQVTEHACITGDIILFLTDEETQQMRKLSEWKWFFKARF